MIAKQAEPELPYGTHLNIGCGAKIWTSFINIDFPGNWADSKPDVACDIRKLPFNEGFADSVYAIHVLEHLQRYETEDVLAEWARVIKPGGVIVIEVPCLDKIIGQFRYHIDKSVPLNPQKTLYRLYGDPKHKNEHMIHKWCFSAAELVELLENAGFTDVSLSEPEYHLPDCDIRISGIKTLKQP